MSTSTRTATTNEKVKLFRQTVATLWGVTDANLPKSFNGPLDSTPFEEPLHTIGKAVHDVVLAFDRLEADAGIPLTHRRFEP